jgi:hypothetical protein
VVELLLLAAVGPGAKASPASAGRVVASCWASCVDPRWPPVAALHSHAAAAAFASSAAGSAAKHQPLHNGAAMRLTSLHPQRRAAPGDAADVGSAAFAAPTSASSSASSSSSAVGSRWATTGGFPQRFRVEFAQPVRLAKLQLLSTGAPTLSARLVLQSDSTSRSATTTRPMQPPQKHKARGEEGVVFAVRPAAAADGAVWGHGSGSSGGGSGYGRSGNGSGLDGESSPSWLPAQLYVLDLPPTAPAVAFELVFEDAAVQFCGVSHLQLWGAWLILFCPIFTVLL